MSDTIGTPIEVIEQMTSNLIQLKEQKNFKHYIKSVSRFEDQFPE